MNFQVYPSFVQTSVQAGDTIANTAAPTAFATKLTIPADSLTEGTIIYIDAGGVYTTQAIALRSIDVGVYLGGNAMLSTGTRTPTLAAASNSPWTMAGSIVITLIGATGTAEGHMNWTWWDNVLGSDETWIGATAIGFTFDSTIDNDLQLYAAWTAAAANNSITMRQFNVAIGK